MASRRQTRQHSLRKQFIREQSVLAQDTVLSFDISPREILQMNQDGLSEHNMVRCFERQTALADWTQLHISTYPQAQNVPCYHGGSYRVAGQARAAAFSCSRAVGGATTTPETKRSRNGTNRTPPWIADTAIPARVMPDPKTCVSVPFALLAVATNR